MLAFRFPIFDDDQSNDHADVEFMINFRTHQICMSYTYSDNVILQEETETTHVQNFQLLLFSQAVGLALIVELLRSGVEHPADILADARDLCL